MAINVTMTSKNGVTLATNGKYCEDNIKVSLSDTDSANLVASNIKNGVTILGYTGTFTNDGTATASDMLSGKTAYVKGSKIEGTIATRTKSNVSVSGNSVFVEPGYYAQSVQKTVGTAKGATTYTPGTSNQTIASGTYLTGTQTIKGDSNLIAANIKNGVSIFGVAGTYSGSGSTLQEGIAYLEDGDDIYFDINSHGSFYFDSQSGVGDSTTEIEIEDDNGTIRTFSVQGTYIEGALLIISGKSFSLVNSEINRIEEVYEFSSNIIGVSIVLYGEADTTMMDIQYCYS